jgi:hypothetical protein
MAEDYFDTAVRWIIIILVVVFDPLAVCLLLAGNVGLTYRGDRPIKMMTENEVMRNVPLASSSTDGHNLS